MAKRVRNSDTGHRYTIRYTKGNTEVFGVPVGRICEVVAKLGGDDITCEELCLYRHCYYDGHEFTLILESDENNKTSKYYV